jgi:hypothetical protein
MRFVRSILMATKPIQVTTQLSVFLANQPGTFAAVCRTLASEGVNIHAFTTSDTVDHQVVRLIVNDPGQAVRALERRGALVLETEVIMLEGDNAPGSLANLTELIADEGGNIEYAYCATPPFSPRGLLILRCSNTAKALRALNRRRSATEPVEVEGKGKSKGAPRRKLKVVRAPRAK